MVKNMDIYAEMSKECSFCGSHNTFQVDDKKGIICCLDCYKSVSKNGNYVSLIYVTTDAQESRCVREAFEKVGSNISGKLILGFHVIELMNSQMNAESLSGILKKDCVNLGKLNITFNRIRTIPDTPVQGDHQKLREFGVISVNDYITDKLEGDELEVIGNSLDGEALLKMLGYLLMMEVKEIRFV